MTLAISQIFSSPQIEFGEIYDDILPNIFKYLPPCDVNTMRGINRRIRAIVNTEVISLDLSERKNISIEELITIKKTFPNLQKIKMPRTATDAHLEAIITEKTIGLDFEGCYGITEDGLKKVSLLCALEEFSTSVFFPADIIKLIIQKRTLQKLKCNYIDNEILLLMGSCLKGLKEFNYVGVEKYSGLKEESIQSLAIGCPYLEVLKLKGMKITENTLVSIAKNCPNIKNLAMDLSDVQIKNLSTMDVLPKLEVFGCNDRVQVDWLIEFLKNAPNLKELRLGDAVANDSVLFAIGRYCKGLEILVCNKCDISDAGIVALSQGCRHLKEFHHYPEEKSKITKKSLIALGNNCSNFEILNFSFLPNVTDIGVTQLAQGCSLL